MASQTRIYKGTLVILPPNANIFDLASYCFTFQYNPDKLVHTLNQATNAPSDSNLPMDEQNYPIEVFNLTFELDSADVYPPPQTQISDNLGLHPALAMLELMMQPQMIGKKPTPPTLLFIWGIKRTVPVRIISMSIEETSFDSTLNPTRANVNLCLRVLDETELKNHPAAQKIHLNHQKTRTILAETYKLQTNQPIPEILDYKIDNAVAINKTKKGNILSN